MACKGLGVLRTDAPAEKAHDSATVADPLSNDDKPLIKRYRALGRSGDRRLDETITHAKAAVDMDDLPAYDRVITGIAEQRLVPRRT